ncbi:MAG TPA: response regulator [Bacteroidia bacterium]|nr:response regulator [Bacteroidia bacterium]
MFSFFKKRKKELLIFIVEDNEIYLRQLTFFLEKKFGKKITIKTFKVAEIALLELDTKPDLIIMDHFLNSKYEDASNGYTMLDEIHKKHPEIKLILHTSQSDVDLAIEAIRSGICKYVSKNKEGFEHIAEIITAMYER